MTSANAERELVAEIRSELAAVEPRRTCDRMAQAAAFAGFTWRATRARQAPLVRSAIRLGHRPGADAGTWSWEESADHCRIAYLRGLFLTKGSLSLANGRVHLEFVLDPAAAQSLVPRLTAMGLPATWRMRRGRGVVTWKSADTVATFLRMAGARTSLFDLEARRVARLLRGELNRLFNAEAANLGRTVDSAARQLSAIQELGTAGRLAALPGETRAVAEARRDAPEATIGELAEATRLHRSAVQRELQRIERFAVEATVRPMEATGRPI